MRISEIVRDFSIPAMIVHSLDDSDVPHSEGQQVADAWPESQLETYKDLGHTRMLWEPASVNRCVEFVTENKTTAPLLPTSQGAN